MRQLNSSTMKYESCKHVFVFFLDITFSARSQETNKVVRQDLNESTLDLSLGLNAHDGDNDTDSKADHRDNWSNE